MSEKLEKVITTSSLGGQDGGGLLSPQQSGRFIDYLWDATSLARQVRTVQMNADNVELNRISVGERLVRLATEAVDDGMNPAVGISKVGITATKLRMDWELSTETLEDNIECAGFEDHIARLMASQAANDFEDVAINGNMIDKSTDPLLKSFDGWRKIMYYGGNVIDANSVTLPDGTADNTLHQGVFSAALRALPRRYLSRRGDLRFFTSTGLLQDFMYRNQFAETLQGGFAFPSPQVNGSNSTPGEASGWSPTAPYGVPAVEVPLFPEYDVDLDGSGSGTATGKGSDVWLTDPQNLIWGVRRAVQVYREFKPRKDTYEFTMYARVGVNVEEPKATVVVKNVAYRD